MKKKWVFQYSVVSLVAFLISFIILVFGDGEVYETALTYAGWALVLIYFFTLLYYTKLNGSFICVFNIFLIYSFLSNCGQTFLNLVGFNEHPYVDVYANFKTRDIYNFLLFQICCICALGIAAIWANYLAGEKNKKLPPATDTMDGVKVGVILGLHYLFAVIVGGQLISRLLLRVDLSYGDAYGEFDGIMAVFWVMYSILFSAVCMLKIKIHTRVAIVIAIVFCVICFALGTRSSAIAIAGILVFLLSVSMHKKHKKVKLKGRQKIGLVVFALFLIGCLSLTTKLRQVPLSQVTFDMVVAYFNPFSAMGEVISEMGTSAATVLKTMTYVDSIGYQQTIAYNGVEMILPHFAMNILGIEKPMVLDIGLGNWVTFYTGSQLAGDSGMGFSYIAESYLNYGCLGWVFTFVHGFVIAWLEKRSLAKALNGYILYPSLAVFYISKQIFFARAQLSLMVSPVRYLIIIIIVSLLLKRVRFTKKVFI